MANWLTTATQVLRGKAPEPEPEPYEITCACGQVTAGERAKAFQSVCCARCQETLFILPISPYPRPKSPVDKKPEPRKPGTSKKGCTAKSREPKAPVIDLDKTLSAVATTVQNHWLTAVFTETAQFVVYVITFRWFTPLVGIGMLVCALLGSVAFWVLHAQSVTVAESTLAANVQAGDDAFATGNLTDAVAAYQKVVHALDTLGRNDPRARTFRQTARELRAVSELAPGTLDEIVRQASLSRQQAAGDVKWEDAFRATYRHAWVLIDAPVTRRPAEGKGVVYHIDLPIFGNSQPGELVADLKAFDSMLVEGESRRLLFAAQLEDCRPHPTEPDTWQIVLHSSSAFLWGNERSLREIGLLADEGTQSLLAVQRTHLGMESASDGGKP